MKESVNYDKENDFVEQVEYIDPKLKLKLDKMKASRIQIDSNKENCPIQGTKIINKKPGKHVGVKTVINQDSDILLLGNELGRKEQIVRPLKRRAADENVYYIEDKNGFLDRYKEMRQSKSAMI
jgi:hypothetical protein